MGKDIWKGIKDMNKIEISKETQKVKTMNKLSKLTLWDGIDAKNEKVEMFVSYNVIDKEDGEKLYEEKISMLLKKNKVVNDFIKFINKKLRKIDES